LPDVDLTPTDLSRLASISFPSEFHFASIEDCGQTFSHRPTGVEWKVRQMKVIGTPNQIAFMRQSIN
jgi:hypothetical protein